MKLIGQAVALVFILALLGAMGFGAWVTVRAIIAIFAGLDPEVARVTGIACAVALAAAWLIAAGIRAAIRQGRAAVLRDEKAATYQLFVDFWENLLGREPVGPAPLPAPLAEKLQVLERLLALYAGTPVIRAHTALRALQRDERSQLSEMRARFGEALLAVREDLGSSASRDTVRELERLIVPTHAA